MKTRKQKPTEQIIPIGNAISRRTWPLWNNLRNWVRVRSGLPPIGVRRR